MICKIIFSNNTFINKGNICKYEFTYVLFVYRLLSGNTPPDEAVFGETCWGGGSHTYSTKILAGVLTLPRSIQH